MTKFHQNNLGDPHENSTVVLSNVKVEVLVLHPNVSTFGKLCSESTILSAKLFEEIGQGVPEFNHALSWNSDLGTGSTSGHRLRDLQNIYLIMTRSLSFETHAHAGFKKV